MSARTPVRAGILTLVAVLGVSLVVGATSSAAVAAPAEPASSPAPGAAAAPAVTVAALPGIDGDGTARDPYQLNSADDLRTAAEAINGDAAGYGAAAYRLTADIAFAGAEFTGINTFGGSLDGAGHSISDIVYVPAAGGGNADRLGLIRTLDGGSVKNLTLQGVRADSGTRNAFVAGIAVDARAGSTLTGNSVLDAELAATNAEKVGGIVAALDSGTITDNWVTGSMTANEMPAGIAAYVKGASTVSNNLIAADLTMVQAGGANGTKGNDAGMVVGYPGTPNSTTFSGNVALSGSISYSGKVDGFVGRILGFTAYDGWTAENNLANTAITISGQPVTGPGTKNQHGTDVTAAALAEQSTYTDLGWDFVNAWAFDAELGHPVPQYTPSLFGNGTADQPYEIGTEADLELLRAQLNDANPRYTGGKHFALTADLDFTERDPFAGINTFDGVLDGRGHSVTGLVFTREPTAGADADHLGLIRRLNGGTVRNLTLVGPRADGGTRTGWVGGIATIATNATISGNAVTDADLAVPAGEKAGGLVGELHGGRITDNWVSGSIRANKMPAGIASYARNTVTLADNLVQADLIVATDGGTGTRGVDAGLVIAYPGNPNTGSTFSGNVALGGSIEYTGTADGFVGRIVGYTGYDGWTARDNLANTAITLSGNPVTGPGTKNQHGTDTAAAALANRTTYLQLGWDFAEKWRWSDDLGHPVPKYVTPDEAPNRITTTFHGDPATRRAFTWYSTLDDQPVVVLSTDREFPEGSSTIEVVAEAETSEHGETLFRAVAQDLTPDTTYYYRLGDAQDSVFSSTGTFRTAGDDGEFTFVDLTDTQSQNLDEAERSAETMAKALKYVPDTEFIVHNGDVVEHGVLEQDWQDLLDSARPSLLNTTLAPAAGNHDEAHNSFADHFTLDAPNDQDTGTGVYYSYTYDSTHFMVLNTNEGGADGISAAQLEWLAADGAQARADGAQWLVLVMHKGVYTTATHLDDGDVKKMRQTLVPVIDDLDIDLVLQGHDHVMSRSKVLAADPSAPQGAKAVETTKITEIRNGKRVDYAVSPQGTLFFLPNTAGAKHYTQATNPDGVDIEQYLQLFDRIGEQSTENFAAISVTPSRLTVDVYDIRDRGVPRMFDGFGIDRQITPVDEKIAGLPAVDAVTADDAAAVAEVRAAVDDLGREQRAALSGLPRLEQVEARIRELQGRVGTDGSAVAWADPEATSRQPLTVRNTTRSAFTDVPVQVQIADTPDVPRTSTAFYTVDGIGLPAEVETWQPGGISTVWVRVPQLPAQGSAQLWAYFGGSGPVGTAADPTAVWSEDYALVEHFGTAEESGNTRPDSTGRQTGELVGADLDISVSDRGTAQSAFAGSRLQYPGDVGGDYDRISVSGIYSVTDAELQAIDGTAPVIAKQDAAGDGQLTFAQDVRTGKRVGTRLAGNSFEFGNVDLRNDFAFPVDGEPHLVTQTYDGMTYSVFVDGAEVHSQMVEYRTTFTDPTVRTTIGDYDTADDSLAAPFHGTLDEVQIAGAAFTPDFEAFRYSNYLGDAVSSGERVSRDEEQITLVAGTPAPGAELEAGLTDVTGSVSKRAVLTAEVAGQTVFTGRVDAGTFTVQVPINVLGGQTLTLRATTADNTTDTSEPVSVPVTVTDTVAPASPEVNSEAASDGTVTLTATPNTDDAEQLTATFYAGPTIELDAENVVVRTGATADRVPDGIAPDAGTVSDELHPTTVGDNENPFQIYEISLTEEQAAQEEFHLVWKGAGDDRRVSAYVYDNGAGTWLRKATGSQADGGSIELDVTATAAENAVSGGKLRMLIWRGLTELPVGERDYTERPDVQDYDWAMDHVPDTQLYAQATPEMMNEQFRYVADVAEERKTALVIQSGDWVNREYLSQEYQWKGVEPAAKALEDKDIPFMVSWGNHDYQTNRNGRVMLDKYFPMSRFADSLDGSPWTFGGSDSIDNYYYTGEIGGAKLLVLTVGFFSADQASDPGLAWGRKVIEDHPDHTVILAVHNSVGGGANSWSNDNVNRELIDPHPNVKLVLGGHITATGVAHRVADDGHLVYGVLTDYQGRVYGGQQFLKHISVDAENDLMYFNTYSPWLDATTSDGPHRQPISEADIPGFHGTESENFVLDLDLGGTTTRTLATESLTLGAGTRAVVGEPQTVIGGEPASVELTDIPAGADYEWYVDLTDPAGAVTRSTVSAIAAAGPQVPGTPTEVRASVEGDTVTVLWQPPAQDGGATIESYEVRLSDGTTTTVAGDAHGYSFVDRAKGSYTATVRAATAAGWGADSAPSNEVTVQKSTPRPTKWSADRTYQAGAVVLFRGSDWTATRETTGEVPGSANAGWKKGR